MAPSPPGTECCLQGSSTGNSVREKVSHAGERAWAKFTCSGQTCCALHTGQPGVNAVACFGECCLYDGSTQDGCGSSDLRVSMADEAKNVADVLLLCKETWRQGRSLRRCWRPRYQSLLGCDSFWWRLCTWHMCPQSNSTGAITHSPISLSKVPSPQLWSTYWFTKIHPQHPFTRGHLKYFIYTIKLGRKEENLNKTSNFLSNYEPTWCH